MKKKIKKFFVKFCACFIHDKSKRRAFRNRYLPCAVDLRIGKHSYHGKNFSMFHPDSRVGAFCSIGENVAVGPSQHPTNWLSTSPIQYCKPLTENQPKRHLSHKPTILGNDIWCGNNAVIQDGCYVGDGAIIASNAVVTHDVPPYAIVGGVPARIIRYRFNEKTIKDLLKLKWWDLPDDVIATLPFENVEQCIKKLKEIRKNLR